MSSKRVDKEFPRRLMLLFAANCVVLGGVCVFVCSTGFLHNRVGVWLSIALTSLMFTVDWLVVTLVGRDLDQLGNVLRDTYDNNSGMSSDYRFHMLKLDGLARLVYRINTRLHKLVAERDREHQLALFEEKEKLRIKKQLTTNLNNELKTPVAAIQVCLETVLGKSELSEDKRDLFLQKAYESSMRLRRMLTDVSTISRIEENSDSIKIERIDVSQIIRQVVEEFQGQLNEKRIELSVNIPPHIFIMGNSFLIMSVFHNIMDNAIAYSQADKIDIELIDDDIDSITFVFSDNGVGVAPQHLNHLFERFYRVEKGQSRKSGGTGLGLSVVKNSILFHGGNIKAESNKGGGLRYTFSLRKM